LLLCDTSTTLLQLVTNSVAEEGISQVSRKASCEMSVVIGVLSLLLVMYRRTLRRRQYTTRNRTKGLKARSGRFSKTVILRYLLPKMMNVMIVTRLR
jgi:ABC-type Fe3+ transport system permease subunit